MLDETFTLNTTTNLSKMTRYIVFVALVCLTLQVRGFPFDSRPFNGQSFMAQPTHVPDCPLEVHPDTETMFVMRGPLGDPEPRNCPPRTYFMKSVCSCVNIPKDKCNLRQSAIGRGWYEEHVFDSFIQRQCAPGSAFSPSTCDCSLIL